MEAIRKTGKLLFYGGRGGQDEVTVHVSTRQKDGACLMSSPCGLFQRGSDPRQQGSITFTPSKARHSDYHRWDGDRYRQVIYGENLAKTESGAGLSRRGRDLLLPGCLWKRIGRTDGYLQDLKSGGPVQPVVTTCRAFIRFSAATSYLQSQRKAPLSH